MLSLYIYQTNVCFSFISFSSSIILSFSFSFDFSIYYYEQSFLRKYTIKVPNWSRYSNKTTKIAHQCQWLFEDKNWEKNHTDLMITSLLKKNTWRILATIFITNGDDCLIEHKFDILTRKAMNPWNINNMNMEGGVLYRIMHYWVSKYTKR